MENRENQDNQNADISKSQSAQQPNFDQAKKPEFGQDKQAELDQSQHAPGSGQAERDQSTDTLAEQKQPSETDSAESLDQRGEGQPGFVGSAEDDASDEYIEREKLSDGE